MDKIFFGTDMREIDSQELERIREEIKDKPNCLLVEATPGHFLIRMK